LSPSRCRRLIDDARAHGVQVQVAHDHVGIDGAIAGDDIEDVGVLPPVGEVYRVAVVSDTHAGSRYAMREQLADFVRYAYGEGCREVLHVGDMLDGCYRHGVFELTHSGLHDQALDAADTLPELPGLHYHAITGNHDFTFAERTGASVGSAIRAVWRDERGRDDLTFHGDRSAFLRIGGCVVHLWHPAKGAAYAFSYPLQKQAEKYTSVKPQVLLAGHWHIFDHCRPRSIEAIACPCFQGGGSAFGKSLGGSPSIGGLILEWSLTEHGTIRDFALRSRRYYEREAIVEVRNRLSGEEVPPAVARPVAVPASWRSCSGAA
jgi:predicted phosphodiesterase